MKSFVIIFVVQFALSNAFTIQPRIVNGVLSNAADFPFFVKIVNPEMLCGGALINDRFANSLIF